MERTGIRHVTDRTVRRLLNRNGYFFLQARKKGLMSLTDKDRRVEFARKMQGEYSPSVWRDYVVFHLDGVSFVYKTNPLDQARAPKGRVWRKRSEGLTQGCLAKGSNSGTGGRVAKFMVVISHSKGVVVYERYEKMDGNYFASFIDQHFNTMYKRSCKGLSRLWLQDGDPSQNSNAAREAMARCHSELLKIPLRSPDLNPNRTYFTLSLKSWRRMRLKKTLLVNHMNSFVKWYKEQSVVFLTT